jgi:hypothetical protein
MTITTRPTVNLARCASCPALTAAVVAALHRRGHPVQARRFAERADGKPMNALCQLAREYVELETRMT